MTLDSKHCSHIQIYFCHNYSPINTLNCFSTTKIYISIQLPLSRLLCYATSFRLLLWKLSSKIFWSHLVIKNPRKKNNWVWIVSLSMAAIEIRGRESCILSLLFIMVQVTITGNWPSLLSLSFSGSREKERTHEIRFPGRTRKGGMEKKPERETKGRKWMWLCWGQVNTGNKERGREKNGKEGGTQKKVNRSWCQKARRQVKQTRGEQQSLSIHFHHHHHINNNTVAIIIVLQSVNQWLNQSTDCHHIWHINHTQLR